MSLFVHAGLAKAGSTFLQERVFSPAAGIHYLGKTRGDYPEWLKQWHYWDDLCFERNAGELRATFDRLRQPGRPNVLSSEIFTMHGGGAAAQARRLRIVAPDASVVLVVRDPVERLLSFYRHLVERDGLHAPLEDCLDWGRTPHVFYKRKPAYLPDSFYDEIVDLYSRLFAGRVCVLRMEEMVSAPDVFFGDLGRFLGHEMDADALRAELRHPENASVGEEAVGSLRLRNAVDALRPFAPESVLRDLSGTATLAPEPLLSDELRGRLEQFFRGKCQGYY